MTVTPPLGGGAGSNVPDVPVDDSIRYDMLDGEWNPSTAQISGNVTLTGAETYSSGTLVSNTTSTLTLPLASLVPSDYLLTLANKSDKKTIKWTVETQGSDTISALTQIDIIVGETYLIERISSTEYRATNASIDLDNVPEATSITNTDVIIIADEITGLLNKINKDTLALDLDGKIAVETDDTIDGDGTTSSPLSIANGVEGSIRVIGFWNADTNSPDLSALTLDQGEAYQVSVSGSTNLNGETNWKAKDLVVWNDNLTGDWFKLDNTDDVISVAGKTGVVTLVKADVGLGNVDNTSDADKPISDDTQTALDAKGDMFKTVYDPTAKNTSAFSMDSMDETATKKILTDTERTNLGNQSGTNTGDQDLSGLQPILAEGPFVDGDKTKLDGLSNGLGYIFTTWGANMQNTGRYPTLNGAANGAEQSALGIWTDAIVPDSGTIDALTYNMDTGNNTTVLKIWKNGSVVYTFTCTGSRDVETDIGVAVSTGDRIGIEYDAGMRPAGSFYSVYIK